MTRSELEQRIENLEERRFLVDMIDRWQPKDYDLYDKLTREINTLKKQLQELQEEPKQKPQNS